VCTRTYSSYLRYLPRYKLPAYSQLCGSLLGDLPHATIFALL